MPSTTTHRANLDLLLRVIQTFLGLGGAALWSLLQLSTTMLKRGSFTVKVHNHCNSLKQRAQLWLTHLQQIVIREGMSQIIGAQHHA